MDAPLTDADAQPAATSNDPNKSLSAWFRANGVQLLVVAVAVFAICRFLHPMDVLLAGFGLSFIIFIHELGHFLAAKWCDVHVKTFSIGFGPSLPFCSHTYGETTYKLGMIPLGGFVAMVGEAEGNNGDVVTETTPEQNEDPRNLKNKTVLQRMLIISAGVIMNVILASILFIITYMNGVEEKPGVLAAVETGGAAWRAGIHSGSEINRINSRNEPWFDDIKPIVFSTHKDEKVSFDLTYDGKKRTLDAEPIRGEGMLAPLLGVNPMEKMTLEAAKRDPVPPYGAGSVFAAAKAADGGIGFQPGDTVVAMTDPIDPSRVTGFDRHWKSTPGEQFDLHRRLVQLAGRPLVFHVVRKGDATLKPVPVTVAPVFRSDLGLRMRMGEIAAIRAGSSAEKAELTARTVDGDKVLGAGDAIVSVEVSDPDGTATRWTTDATETAPPTGKTKLLPLDPLRLPHELDAWALKQPTGTVRVTILRDQDHTPQRRTVDLAWDDSYRHQITTAPNAATPTAINGLGLAYQVLAVVNAVEPYDASERLKPLAERTKPSPAAAAGLLANDKILEVKFKPIDHTGKPLEMKFQELRPHHWGFVDASIQYGGTHALEVKYERDGKTATVELTATPDPTIALPARGLVFAYATRLQQADGVVEALGMGAYRTVRAIRMTYQGLYALVFGRLSIKTMSGPFTLASTTYLVAGQDVSHLLLWLALISINLAVVNFLPIPVLDGGHMVFLIYEGIRRKPAPESVQVILTYVGLAMVLSLMLFVIGLDIWRLFF